MVLFLMKNENVLIFHWSQCIKRTHIKCKQFHVIGKFLIDKLNNKTLCIFEISVAFNFIKWYIIFFKTLIYSPL